VDFTLSEEQDLLQRTAQRLLGEACPSSLVREVADDPSAADELWPALSEWVALGDGPLVDLCLFCEQAGHVLLPGPWFATTALLLPLLRATGHPSADDFASGERSGTVAVAGRDGHWRVSGDDVRTFVPEADLAEAVAVVEPGPAVTVVRELPTRLVGTLDLSRRFFEVDVSALDGERHSLGGDQLDAWLDRARVAVAAEMLGGARWMLQAAVAYAGERVQFDQPIGAFQAIQHKLADLALEVERAHAAVYYAAMAVDAGDPDARRASHVAKASAGSAATRAAKDSIQVHGGVGYTWEHDLHLYIRRAYTSEHLLGSREWHHDRIADLLLRSPATQAAAGATP